jgi:hypothetical protein
VYYQYPVPNQEFITDIISGKYHLTFGAMPLDAWPLNYGDFVFPHAITLFKVYVPYPNHFPVYRRYQKHLMYLLVFVYVLSFFS